MATVTITGNTIRGATTSRDNRTWQIRSIGYQPGGVGGGVITPGADWETLYPVDGVLTFTAESGSVVDIKTPDEIPYRVRIPTSNAGLWDTIEAGVAYQPNVSQDLLNTAVANAAPGFIAAELGTQTADAISTDLDAREIGFVDEGEGSGHFTIISPDGEVIDISGTLVPPGALWSSLAGKPMIYPIDFGAVGDGVTDDTEALQDALDAASDGGTVILNQGVYAYSAPLEMGLGTVLIGAGRNRYAANGGSRLLAIHADARLVLNTQCHVMDLLIDGNFVGDWGVYSGYVGHTKCLTNVQVIKCVEQAYVLDAVQNSTFISCTSRDTPIGFGLYNGCQILEFISCTTDNSGGVDVGYGGEDARAILISNNYGDGRMGAQIYNNGRITFFGGVFERGPGDYRVEILKGGPSSGPIHFNSVVVGGSASTLANLHIGPDYAGEVILSNSSWAFNGDGGATQLVDAEAGQLYIDNMKLSGAAGRNIITKCTVSGTATVGFNETSRRLLHSEFLTGLSTGAGNWAALSTGTVSHNATKKRMDLTCPNSNAGGSAVWSGYQYYAQQYGVVTVRFRLANCTGQIRLSTVLSGSPWRRSVGAFSDGAHEVVVELTGDEQGLAFSSESGASVTAEVDYITCEHGGFIGGATNPANPSGTATINVGALAPGTYLDNTITVAGAEVGESVALGVPAAAITDGVVYSAWVSAANTVTVRADNYTSGVPNPASGVFKATIVR